MALFVVVVVVVQLIHRLMQADISCTTTARLFFFPLLGHNGVAWNGFVLRMMSAAAEMLIGQKNSEVTICVANGRGIAYIYWMCLGGGCPFTEIVRSLKLGNCNVWVFVQLIYRTLGLEN